METKLLPCWRCGGKAVLFGGAGELAVKCNACGVTNEPLIADETTYLGYEGYATAAEAIEAWNTRHERTCGEWRGEPASYGVDDTLELWCEHCDIPLEDWNYCPNCGAKVVK